jgi:hypothetical protein
LFFIQNQVWILGFRHRANMQDKLESRQAVNRQGDRGFPSARHPCRPSSVPHLCRHPL